MIRRASALARGIVSGGVDAVVLVRWGLVVASVALVASLPVLPCQDLPQHLSYVRILLDYDQNDLVPPFCVCVHFCEGPGELSRGPGGDWPGFGSLRRRS